MDKAKEKQVIAETRSLLTAIQTEASELYAEDKIPQDNQSLQNYPALASKNGVASDDDSYFLTSDELKENYNKIVSLSELKSLENGKGSFICAVDGDVYKRQVPSVSTAIPFTSCPPMSIIARTLGSATWTPMA